jgi:hypothetical protein
MDSKTREYFENLRSEERTAKSEEDLKYRKKASVWK